MRKLHEDGTEPLRVRIPKNYADALRRLAVGGKTVSGIVREALDRFFGIAAGEPQESHGGAGMMFPKQKWKKGRKGD